MAVRVPVEVLKQRLQVSQYNQGILAAARLLYLREGLLGFYRGFQATVAREIPFACIQFPLYEALKANLINLRGGHLDPWQAALCGSVAGGVTAALTTPFDVLKTRVMLGGEQSGLRHLVRSHGVRILFAGLVPRVTWISAGGFIFFGLYEHFLQLI